jgi:ubiquitin C-terminal hydrolase
MLPCSDQSLEYKCDSKEGCTGTVVTETKKITGLPNVLIIHLKRFSYAVEDGIFVQKKHAGAVRIPKELDIAQFCSRSARTPADMDASINESLIISAPLPSARSVKRRIVRGFVAHNRLL